MKEQRPGDFKQHTGSPAVSLGVPLTAPIDIVKEVASEEEALAENLLDENPELLQEYQKGSGKAHEPTTSRRRRSSV